MVTTRSGGVHEPLQPEPKRHKHDSERKKILDRHTRPDGTDDPVACSICHSYLFATRSGARNSQCPRCRNLYHIACIRKYEATVEEFKCPVCMFICTDSNEWDCDFDVFDSDDEDFFGVDSDDSNDSENDSDDDDDSSCDNSASSSGSDTSDDSSEYESSSDEK